jgi:hypothetical protein
MSQEEIPDCLAEEKDDLLVIYKSMLNLQLPYKSKYLPKINSKIVKVINLYTTRFSDDFQEHIVPFFNEINNLVCQGRINACTENDRYIQNLVIYYKDMIHNRTVEQTIMASLGSIFNFLLLPNIMMQPDDIEEFEDDPDAFMIKDLQEADQESRRRNCMIMVNQLCTKYKDQTMEVLNQVL